MKDSKMIIKKTEKKVDEALKCNSIIMDKLARFTA